MAKIPQKLYFNVKSGKIINANGSNVGSPAEVGKMYIGEKGIVNIQLISSNAITDTYTDIPAGSVAQWITDNDFSNPTFTAFTVGSANWTASSSGTNEYYYTTTITEPEGVWLNALQADEGTLGSLAAGEWGFGDNDTIGESRVYVRLSDGTDPDTKASGYLQYLEAGTYTAPFIQADSSYFNQANEWWTGSAFATADITLGQISFALNASTSDFNTRLGTSSEGANTRTQIQFLEASTAEMFLITQFTFRTLNKYSTTPLSLDVVGVDAWTKTQADARYVIKASSWTNGNLIEFDASGNASDSGINVSSILADTYTETTLTDDATTDITLGAIATYRAFVIEWVITLGANSMEGVTRVVHNGTIATVVTEYQFIGTELKTFDFEAADISGANARWNVTATAVGGGAKMQYRIVTKKPVTT